MKKIRTMQEAERLAAQAGVTLTAKDRERIAALQNAERARTRATEQSAAGRMEQFNAAYAKFLDAMLHVTDLIQALGRTLIVGAGMVAILIIALIVEQQRLVDGLLLFEARAAIAHGAAWFVVLLNVSLEFTIHYEDQRRGWHDANRRVWSLRIAWRNLKYRLGFGDEWTEREQPPSYWARALLRTVTVAVLALALFGSMKDEIALQAGKPWHVGLRSIVEMSDLTLAVTWLSGLLFAFVAVRGAQGTARYLARRTAEVIDELNAEHEQDDDSAVDAVGVNYVMAKLAKKAERDDVSVAELTHGSYAVPVGTNGTNGGHGF